MFRGTLRRGDQRRQKRRHRGGAGPTQLIRGEGLFARIVGRVRQLADHLLQPGRIGQELLDDVAHALDQRFGILRHFGNQQQPQEPRHPFLFVNPQQLLIRWILGQEALEIAVGQLILTELDLVLHDAPELGGGFRLLVELFGVGLLRGWSGLFRGSSALLRRAAPVNPHTNAAPAAAPTRCLTTMDAPSAECSTGSAACGAARCSSRSLPVTWPGLPRPRSAPSPHKFPGGGSAGGWVPSTSTSAARSRLL